MKQQYKTLSWNDRLAIIDHFKPSDKEIVSAFGVTQDELDTARSLRGTGLVVPTANLDTNSYSSIFGGKTKTATATLKRTTAIESPQTASKPIRVPKKRGRKGEKISAAFKAIPYDKVSVETFAGTNHISIAVLRQSKRFDSNPELGSVRVKKDKETNTLMIWRDQPEAD